MHEGVRDVGGRDELAYRAAELYYGAGETMESIAAGLGVSRSTVSRLLQAARDEGLVRITLAPPPGSSLGRRLHRAYGVTAHVVAVRPGSAPAHQLEPVALRAAALVEEAMRPGAVLGLAWGTTVAAVVSRLRRTPCPGSEVVQLNGSAHSHGSGIPYSSSILEAAAAAFDSDVHHFPVPAFFDFPETKRALWRERSVRAVLERQARCDLAVFGVGAFGGNSPSHVYNAGYLDDAEVAALAREGVAGDVCTVLLRTEGSYADIAINERATGPNPAQLQHIARRICVVAGVEKATATLAALRARVATDLVIDDVTARAVLAATRE